MKLKKSVDDEIRDSIEINYKWWRVHDRCALGCILSSVVLSFLAGINAAYPISKNSLLGIALSSSPAFLIIIERTLKLAAKAKWHWDMVLEYQALERSLERCEVTREDASRRISEIEARGDSKYPLLSGPA